MLQARGILNEVIPFPNKHLLLTRDWFVVAQFIAPLICGDLIALQNLYNARFSITLANSNETVARNEMEGGYTEGPPISKPA